MAQKGDSKSGHRQVKGRLDNQAAGSDRRARQSGTLPPSGRSTPCTQDRGCIPQTLREWVKQAEKDSGLRNGVTTEEIDRIKALERENRELRQANEILRKVSAYFAQAELDRPLKR
jgi:hypothetical protein